MDSIEDIERLLDSIDEDESTWNKRSVIKLFAMMNKFRNEAKNVENNIHKLKTKATWISRFSSFFSILSTASGAIQLVRELVVTRDGFIKPSAIYMTVLLIGSVSQLILTSLTGYLQSMNPSKKVDVANEVIQEYYYLIQLIEGQIYRKADRRTNFPDFLSSLNRAYQKNIKLSTELGIVTLSAYDKERKDIRRLSDTGVSRTPSSDSSDTFDSFSI